MLRQCQACVEKKTSWRCITPMATPTTPTRNSKRRRRPRQTGGADSVGCGLRASEAQARGEDAQRLAVLRHRAPGEGHPALAKQRGQVFIAQRLGGVLGADQLAQDVLRGERAVEEVVE